VTRSSSEGTSWGLRVINAQIQKRSRDRGQRDDEKAVEDRL